MLKEILAFFCASCVSMSFEEAKKLTVGHSSAVNSYLLARMEYENGIHLDEQNNCYKLPGGGITQILRINEKGVVDMVVSNTDNEKSKCFHNLYMGKSFKAPPEYPIYSIMLMGYNISRK